ncbi:MAG TPA: sensor histidine kinase [Solirubrobacteraceae bacterium]|jgi:signal transduction histidine kinase|nr:sensor histidine kinase [Solirubrobacteraceae bacterium]
MSTGKAIRRREDWLEFWERREAPFLRAMPYVLLLLCVAFDVAARHGLGGPMRIDLALAVAAALVMTAMDRVDHRTEWTDPLTAVGPAIATAVFAVLLGISAALVIRQPLYGFYTWTGYFWAWRLFTGRGRLIGVALVAAVTAISQTGAGPYDSVYAIGGLIVVYLINTGVAGALTWFGWIGNEQKQRRARELSALTEANARLEESLRHNADLQEQLLTQARETGVSEERRRMAREIHDTLAQGLMGIITQLQAAQGAGAAVGGEEARHIELAISLARESLTEARRSVQALSPQPLAEARLPDAIQDVARRWCELHALEVSFTTTGTPRVMRPEVEVALLRTAQEALANVAKHAHATRVGLTLSYMEDVVTLDVRDDGVGFTTLNGSGPRRPLDATGGFGLGGMRQRVEGVAGTLEIESEPDGGTAVCAAIPAAPVGGG